MVVRFFLFHVKRIIQNFKQERANRSVTKERLNSYLSIMLIDFAFVQNVTLIENSFYIRQILRCCLLGHIRTINNRLVVSLVG